VACGLVAGRRLGGGGVTIECIPAFGCTVWCCESADYSMANGTVDGKYYCLVLGWRRVEGALGGGGGWMCVVDDANYAKARSRQAEMEADLAEPCLAGTK
jgi:hypothetical protein